ncbi:hypothetical protein E2562_034695 [Oryza meyeriana var. granulata]|uniref:Citrate synthase n=1 Tax=Oryza meyeriana var. granulata TaxID=110450 RepID=A0A6G1C2D6_9ORYZ|nr:hypothetical protein E2562_034695 [Oryza meyeriana var. granulata]
MSGSPEYCCSEEATLVQYRARKMSGFGHRVYKNYDPRAKVIRKLAEEVFSIVGRDPLIELGPDGAGAPCGL